MLYNKKKYGIEEKDQVTLSGRLSEFRTALRNEIDACLRHESSSAVPLVNGRKISQIGSSYQYVFNLENIINVPGDAPGELVLPGKSPVDVIIISVDGTAITLSVPENIGKFVPNARLKSNLAFLLKKLVMRIEAHSDLDNKVGERILEPQRISGDPKRFDT